MAQIVAINSDVKGDSCSVRLLISAWKIRWLDSVFGKAFWTSWLCLSKLKMKMVFSLFAWFDSPSRSLFWCYVSKYYYNTLSGPIWSWDHGHQISEKMRVTLLWYNRKFVSNMFTFLNSLHIFTVLLVITFE